MLSAHPQGLFSWSYHVEDGSREVAEIRSSFWGWTSHLKIDGVPYLASRKGLLLKRYVLTSEERVVAQADRPNPLSRAWRIDFRGQPYRLRPQSLLGRVYELWFEDRSLGTIRPASLLGRSLRASFSKRVPLELKIFLIWIFLTSWREDLEEGDD